MSGFLLDLLSRHRGAVSPVRPRLASVFEPEASSPFAAASEASAPSRGDATPSVGSADVEHVDELSELEPPAVASPRPTFARADSTRRERAAPRVPQREPEAALRTREEPGRSESAATPSAPAPMASNTLTRAVVPELAGHGARADGRPARTQEDGDPREKPALARVARVVRAAGEPAVSELETAASSDDAPAARARPSAGAAKPTLSAPPLRRPPLAAMRESKARPEPARPVQVTIGRIEVRAIVESAPRRKERGASLVLGLEDYLKSRAGGKRP